MKATPYIPNKVLNRELRTIPKSYKVSKNSRWHQLLMHSPLALVGWLPRPGLILLQAVANTVQNVGHVLPNCWEKFVTMERASYREVQVRKARIWVSSDDWLLVGGNRVPAESIIIWFAATVQNLR